MSIETKRSLPGVAMRNFSNVRSIACLVIGLLFFCAGWTRGDDAPKMKRQIFLDSIAALVSDVEQLDGYMVVHPNDIEAGGRLPGDGLIGQVPKLSGEFAPSPVTRPLKTIGNSPKGAYCAGLILQVMDYAFRSTLQASNPPSSAPARLEFASVAQANMFTDAWYLAIAGATDPASKAHRGIVHAAEIGKWGAWPAGDPAKALFATRIFSGNHENLVQAAETWANVDAAQADLGMRVNGPPSGTGILKKYDFIQMWMPSTLNSTDEMAHAAIYMGFGLVSYRPDPTKTDALVAVRIFYWSSHYENLSAAAFQNNFRTADESVYVDSAAAAAATLAPERRVGYSYVDITTKIVADTLGLPEVTKLRKCNSLYAASFAFRE